MDIDNPMVDQDKQNSRQEGVDQVCCHWDVFIGFDMELEIIIGN